MHDHDHDHDHESGSADQSSRRLGIAFGLIAGFMVVEVIGGVVSGSLALLADAAHMATDAFALGMAFLAARAARRPADAVHSYGHERVPVLAAFVNGLLLLALAGWIVVEAVSRLLAPAAVDAPVMLAVATVGLVVNLVVLAMLHNTGHHGHVHANDGHAHGDINVQGATAHVVGDLLGSVAAITAGVAILFTGWLPIDPLLSMVVAGIITVTGLRLTRRAARVLTEGTPADIDTSHLRERLCAAIPGVVEVHHVHCWALTPQLPLLTLHASIDDTVSTQEALMAIHHLLRSEWGIEHATVQIEPEGCIDALHGGKC